MMNSSQLDALPINHLTTSVPKKTQQTSSLLAYRFMIFYRFILALIGGYVLASLSAVVIAQYFAESRGNAAMSATLIAFTLWVCAFIWVFIVNKTLKASLGIILPSIFLFVIYKFLGN
ncbi:hypothetical protein B9T25_05800 [Acinetobacter sp. ANC 4470]|uniref:hypothetical protein n=1 Tax=Acinetobacter sp. ANC 4470 TaxID=1977881 RepID=UPI000A33F31F|nr:hypothetical protein [Acinetobacter sp. ANC 4470]OTG68203.1 hypothetical protein B9T25_05800 [Acinetobacter sp. ANC 4470]